MKLHIEHTTNYAFSEPVRLFPHVFRFKPRASTLQDVHAFSLTIMPLPLGIAENWDGGGNDVQHAWFGDPTDKLDLLAVADIETKPDNPLDFIIYPFESTKFPIVYSEGDALSLRPFLVPVADEPALWTFAEDIVHESGGELIPFVFLLIKRIYQQFKTVVRETGEPLKPMDTFMLKEGSCRDLVFLALAILRYKGIASRFVSGYQYLDDETLHDLHAWVEIYFPGGGWRGFDTTTGCAIDERYVRVSAGAAHTNTLPVTGSYGGSATSVLRTAIRIWRR